MGEAAGTDQGVQLVPTGGSIQRGIDGPQWVEPAAGWLGPRGSSPFWLVRRG